jgi:hypothetical protein
MTLSVNKICEIYEKGKVSSPTSSPVQKLLAMGSIIDSILHIL